MKLRRKLMFGFIGSSLLVGVTAATSVILNTSIKNDVIQVNQISIKEVEYATEMTLALEAIQTNAQELLVKKYKVILNPSYRAEAEKEAKETLRKLNKEIYKFEQNLSFSKTATETALRLAKKDVIAKEQQEEQEEKKQMKRLNQLKSEFVIHKKLVAQYVYNVNINPIKAEEFLGNFLEPHFRKKIISVTREFEANAEAKIAREIIEIEEAIVTVKIILITLTLATLFIAIFLAFLISNHISKPIIKLKEAAIQIGRGKLDTRVDIKSKDEIGVLSNAFNQMLDDLRITRLSKTYVDNIIDSMNNMLIVTNYSATIVKVNQATISILGYKENELIGKPIQVVFTEELCKELKIDDLIKKGFIKNIEKTYLTKDGRKIPVSCSGSVMRDDNGKIQGIVCVAQDITDRKRAESALRESEERYALAAHGANDGLWDWNLKTNKVYFSPRWKSMLGYAADEIGDSPDEWFNRVHPEDIEQVKLEITAHLEGLTRQFENEHRTLHSHQEFEHYIFHYHYKVEHRMLHKDGTYHWILNRGIALQDPDGKTYRLAGSQTDITDRKWAEVYLLHNALHDSLTQLPNRVLFMDRLGHALKRAQGREDYLFAVLFLDLDRFKVVNDSLGHVIGDQLLIAIAHRLQACVRPGDTVARLGGDEFTILLENIQSLEDATQVAERIQQELTLPFHLGEHEVFTTASIGIALSTTDYDQPEDLLRDADITMYRAKAQGKVRYQVFDRTMHTQAVALLQLETGLRRALERQEFRLHYQPIVSLASGRISGFEALLRWQHPQRGLVSPAEFIPVAEETGLIAPIGWWVLSEACRQMRAWQAQFPTKAPLIISVNFSGKQFLQADMVEQIDQILQETSLDARNLGLEITESAIIDNAESANIMWQLQCLGVKLFLDDFGTGYSSLSYLYRFPFNTLKIDRSFVRRMGINGENSEIVQTIVTLAHTMDMNVTAEGVEIAAQLDQLRALKCEYGQGFLFSKPVDCKAAGALLAAQPQ